MVNTLACDAGTESSILSVHPILASRQVGKSMPFEGMMRRFESYLANHFIYSTIRRVTRDNEDKKQ